MIILDRNTYRYCEGINLYCDMNLRWYLPALYYKGIYNIHQAYSAFIKCDKW